MGSVAYLWNPRSKHRLRREWISFEHQIAIDGEEPGQTGLLTLKPAGRAELHARLSVMGREFEQQIEFGNDIIIWINGLEIFIGVKAVEEGRCFAAFGVLPGQKVRLTLDAEPGDARSCAVAVATDCSESDPSCIGLRQTRL